MNEIEYKGWRILQTDVDLDCHGFRMPHLFKVVDEFDEALPVIQTAFWSPMDAMLAIDFVVDVYKDLRQGQKWPTTKTHEMNMAVAYRGNFINVYHALKKIRTIVDDCTEMGDDPSKPIIDVLDLLHHTSVTPR